MFKVLPSSQMLYVGCCYVMGFYCCFLSSYTLCLLHECEIITLLKSHLFLSPARNELNRPLPGPLCRMGHAAIQLYRRQHEDALGQAARVHLGHIALAPRGSHLI